MESAVVAVRIGTFDGTRLANANLRPTCAEWLRNGNIHLKKTVSATVIAHIRARTMRGCQKPRRERLALCPTGGYLRRLQCGLARPNGYPPCHHISFPLRPYTPTVCASSR